MIAIINKTDKSLESALHRGYEFSAPVAWEWAKIACFEVSFMRNTLEKLLAGKSFSTADLERERAYPLRAHVGYMVKARRKWDGIAIELTREMNKKRK